MAAECVWSVSSGAEWIAITSNNSGQGSGVVNFAAASNPAASVRRGAVIVSDRRVELMQAAAACQFNLSPATASIGSNGDEGDINVTVAAGCTWSATSQTPWLSVVSGQSGTGAGSVRYRVDANSSAPRSGALTIGDRSFTVNQGGTAGCALALGRTERSVPASGGTDVVSVNGTGDCPWAAESRAAWITITSGAAGSGSGTVSLDIAPNTGGPRSGVVIIAGYMYLVTQAATPNGNCSYSIDSAGQSLSSSGGSANIAVSASGGCNWSAVSHASWISIVGGGNGSGNGVVTFTAAPNPGPERQGLVTVAGYTHTVTQQGADSPSCSYSIGASQLSAPAGGASATVSVMAPGGCPWTATSQMSWITVTNGGSGNGNGSVNLSVASNGSAQRSGVVTIAGHTYTVTQSAGSAQEPPPPPECSFGISSPDQTVTAVGGPATVGVTAGSNCSWSAVSDVPWVLVISGSGSGNGTVVLNVGVNTGGQRVGHVTIAGQVHTLTQVASPIPGPGPGPAPCSYELGAADASVASGGGIVNVALTSGTGCDWTAASQAPWITVTNGASGSGNGTVRLSVAANSGSQRVGTVTIAGETFTVTQSAAAACTYSISPTTQGAGALGGDFNVSITTQAGCAWTAVAQDGWIQITSNTTGTGSGRRQLPNRPWPHLSLGAAGSPSPGAIR